MTKDLFKKQGKIFGLDSTSMEMDHASSHYCKRIDRDKPVKGFVNLNMICDVKNKKKAISIAIKIMKFYLAILQSQIINNIYI